MSDQWCLIESDPGVFTELIRDFGVSGIQVEELYSLQPECFENLKPVLGLIFLFKWVPDDFSDGKLLTDPKLLDKIFFAKQVIQNACATQALINILMNVKHECLKLGQTLTDLKEFTQSFDSTMKGYSIGNSEVIRKVHNSFSRQQMFEFDGIKGKKDKEDVFHFIGYIPFEGRLIELDGLKDGPYDLGPIGEKEDWVDVARPHIQKRMQKYSGEEIHFNLMAVVTDRKMLYEKQIAELRAKNLPESKAAIEELEFKIKQEVQKMERYKIENIRRKHNYLPLIVEILKQLAQDGKLVELYDKAKQKALQQKEKEKQQQKQQSNAKAKV